MLMASNAIAVPLAPAFPAEEMRYQINQSGALALLYSNKFAKIGTTVLQEGLDHAPKGVQLDKILPRESYPAEKVQISSSSEEARGGMMLYTSGTTAKPKGVLLPQSALEAQSKSLAEAWEYSPKDRLLHVLPLHHIHGTVNALLTPLLTGATIEFMFPFNVDKVWNRLSTPFLSSPAEQQPRQQPITFFTVVPTIWARMLQTADKLPEESKKAAMEAIQRKNLRLNISGSAALPTPTKAAWTELSQGNVLLERYGMTEVGMALSCGLADSDRVDGSVGWPLPSVQARLVNSDTGETVPETALGESNAGEIQLHGPTIFREYFANPEATKKEFTEDGWFKTGDIAFRQNVEGAGTGASGKWATGPAWFIQGRKSADIIKTGGEKISALEIERQLLSLPEVSECAVVGLPSEAWGQKAAAIVVLTEQGKTAGKGGKEWSALDMRRALKERLAAYKIPQDMEVVQELPRNAMGKINKKDLVSKVFGDPSKIRRRSIEVKEQRDTARSQANGKP
jgi:acyl-CoA synthetase (AMP-forming)/AMP-acid ligase II